MGAHTELQNCPRGRWWPCRALRWMASAHPGRPGSIARGLSRLRKTISPGLNCITWCPGNIPWGCAAYFISVLRAGAGGSPWASGAGMGFACSTNPAALLPGTAAWGHPSAAGRGATGPNQPWHGRLRCTAPSPSSGMAAPAPLTSSPSLDARPFLSTSTPLESQPFCCAYASLPKSDVPSPTSFCEGKLLLPPTSQRSSPQAQRSRALASSPFQPCPRSTGRNSLCGTWTEIVASGSAPCLAPCTPSQGANPHQLPPHTPGPSSLSFCCPSSSAESAHADQALHGLTPALTAAQPYGKRHIDARCSLRL